MSISWRTLLAPFIGGLAGFLAARGLALDPTQQAALLTLCAGGCTAAMHLLEVYMSPKPTPTVTTVAGKADPARKAGGWARLELLAALALLGALAGPLLSGCSSFGAPAPKSADEGIAYAYGLYTGVEQGLANAVTAGEVSKATAAKVDQAAGEARSLLDAAKAAELADPSTSATDLARASAVLNALQGWLAAGAAGSPPL
jgi:hypothetical protein